MLGIPPGRIRLALRVLRDGSWASREQLLPVLDHFVRAPLYASAIPINPRNDFEYDSERNLIVPPQPAFEWLISPRNGLMGAWDSCLEAVTVKVDRFTVPMDGLASESVTSRQQITALLVSFEHVEDAALFRLRWEGSAW